MFNSSELILSDEGAIYHLNLLPEDLADTIILVGDPHRVARVSRHFDRIEVEKSKREFVTHTGYIGDKRVTVIGTGIGAGNIDIVINECDALANIDFDTMTVKGRVKQLRFIRMGTSGSLHESIPVDSLLVSQYAVGLDGLPLFYEYAATEKESQLLKQARSAFPGEGVYAAAAGQSLVAQFDGLGASGITLTCSGFYGPQARGLRVPLTMDVFQQAGSISIDDYVVTNAEMETSAIYALANIFGHQACSINAIVANRAQGVFSQDVNAMVEQMIERSLEIVAQI